MSVLRLELDRAPPVSQSPATLLSGWPLHTVASVDDVHAPGALGERLLELGLTPGTPITVVRRGLFGDPLQVQVRGYMLTLRRAQAQQVAVRGVGLAAV